MKIVDSSNGIFYYVIVGSIYLMINTTLLYFALNQYDKTLLNVGSIFALSQVTSVFIVVSISGVIGRVIYKMQLMKRVIVRSNASVKVALKNLFQAQIIAKDSGYFKALSVEVEQDNHDQDKLVTEFVTDDSYGFIKIEADSHELETTDMSALVYDSPSETPHHYHVCEVCQEKLVIEARKEITPNIKKQLVAQNI